MMCKLHGMAAERANPCHRIEQKTSIRPRSRTANHGPDLAQPIHQERANGSPINQ